MVSKKKDENNLGFLPHLLSLLQSFMAPVGLIGVIVTYAAGQGELKKQSVSALNWQISLLIYTIISAVLVLVLVGFLLLAILWILNTIFSIMALIKAGNGEYFEYPMSIKFIK